jgi:hypothetical protein
MSIINFGRIFPKILENIITLRSYLWIFVKWLFRNKTLWSGLIPTIVLALIAYYGLKQTNNQLKLLQEQVSYQRQPVVIVYSRPVNNSLDIRLHIANVGNDTIDKVNFRLGLFLVNDTAIYSYGQFTTPMVFLGIREYRTPRQRIWPMLTLAPNDEIDLTDRMSILFYQPFSDWRLPTPYPDSSEIMSELSTVSQIFGGEYVLFIEYSYRRKSDFVQYTDTAYYHYDPYPYAIQQDLKQQIGGYKVIDRLKTYMRDGPELIINIYSDKYEVDKLCFGTRPTTIMTIPRKRGQ